MSRWEVVAIIEGNEGGLINGSKILKNISRSLGKDPMKARVVEFHVKVVK